VNFSNENAMIEPIILGHNQFMGTNHLSAEKGSATERYFSDLSNIKSVFDVSMENGVNGYMLSTHERAVDILNMVSSDKKLADNLTAYALLPYITKYVKGANEKGMINVVRDSLASANTADKFKILFQGGIGALKKDLFSILKSLINIELLPFSKVNVGAVFLHDLLTDLALAYDIKEIFEFYYEYIESKYNVRPAFATKNLPFLLDKFAEYGISEPTIMASANKCGFQVNPSLEQFENGLNGHNLNFIAMSTLAGGALKPPEAYEYLSKFPNLRSVVVGVSTPEHAEETFSEIKRCIKFDNPNVTH